MKDFLEFTFASGWHYLGVVILIVTIGGSFSLTIVHKHKEKS